MPIRTWLWFVAVCLQAQPVVVVTAERVGSAPLLSPASGTAISPAENWRGKGVFNAAAVRKGNKTVLLFRAQDGAGVSRIGYAERVDGGTFTVRDRPVLAPEADYEKGGGVEDARVVRIGKLYYMTYTGYNGHDAQLCLATSRDLMRWERKGVILPAYQGTWNTQWTKSGAIVPQKIQGKWWMYYLGTKKDTDGQARDYMGLASSPDLLHWADATPGPVLERRPGAFDSRVMEPGPAPIFTKAGLLLLYNGATEALTYGPGWALFDAKNPARLIARSEGAFLKPELEWEKKGQVPNVIFLEGVTPQRGLALTGFYGAADTYIGEARISIRVTKGR